MSERPGRFFIKVCWHNFTSSTRLTNDRPCHFHFSILCSFEIIVKSLSVALEVSLSIFSFFETFVNI